jgi:NAD(P)H-dependent flavin oxidoreductase YrpB (nitropropane dioxygenase family)
VDFLRDVRLIQGGMGVHVSNWRLARAVSLARPGVTAGTVSGTALDVVYARLLQLGDPGGHARRALRALDEAHGVGLGASVRDRYFIEGGKVPEASFRNTPPHMLRIAGGTKTLPVTAGPAPATLGLDAEAIELLIATAFAEVWLAKQSHDGKVFINFLNKIEIPLIFALYGAMLAGVDGVIVGAGNPDGLAEACSRLSMHDPVSRRLSMLYRETGEEFVLRFDPCAVAGGRLARVPLKRPALLAIVSLEDLAKALAASDSEPPDGFVIEHHTAGGHNANPVGPLTRDALGQPVYGPRDEADLASIRALGLPFWLAGGYGSADGLARARASGAVGIQVGSSFALAEDSGMKPAFRTAILAHFKKGRDDSSLVRTTLFSPTGFSFKVVQLAETLSEQDVYDARPRVCDLGVLQQWGFGKPDDKGERALMHRCPSGPIDSYVSRRGLERATEQRRCLCNGLLATVGLGQVRRDPGGVREEPAIVTLGSHLDGARRLSRQGQAPYWAHDVVADILGDDVA